MDYTTLKNRVFEKYYFNAYLPGTLGAYESSIIFNYLLSLESIQENLTEEMNINEKWADTTPTWYTSELSNLFFVPKFIGEYEQEYLDRLILLVDVGQDEDTIVNAVFSVIEKAIANKSKIQIIDKLEGVDALWGDSGGSPPDDWDGTSVWSSAENVQRTLFAVHINFESRGSTTDITTVDYWLLPENYTKIESMVNLYKPPGSTFELRLNIPDNYEQEITKFSNTLIN